MEQEATHELKQDIIDLKDFDGRQFKVFTDNFHVMKAAVRYFTVGIGMSFTSTKVSKNFPITASVAGSCLNMMEKLDVLESRNSSASPKRFQPKNVDLERLLQVEKILVDSLEIRSFTAKERPDTI